MFTGIVQAKGTVRSIRNGSSGARLALTAPDLTRPIALGASVAVSGVCLTVAAADETTLEFDVIPETLSRSTLGRLVPGMQVNLERALRAGDSLDGHTVQGHVDAVGVVRSIRTGRDGHIVAIQADAAVMPFMIPKGSVAIDGVSLTIASVEGEVFTIALIPTTLGATTLNSLKTGDTVNIETDILARTIVTTMQRWRNQPGRTALSVESLRENGW